MRFGREKWTTARVLTIQASIDREIAALPSDGAKHHYIEENLETYQKNPEQDGGYIKLFFFSLALMRRYIFSSTLSASQVKSLADQALGILRIHQIAPDTSRLGFLYSRIYLALAMFYQRQGEPIAFLHQLSLAKRAAAKAAPEAKPDFAYEMANFYYHNGYLLQAIDAYHTSITAILQRFADGDLEYVATQRHAIEFPLKRIITALRHLAAYDLADEITAGIKVYSDLYSRRFLTELSWEQLWRQSARDGHFNAMYYDVKKGKAHHNGKYLLDCLFLRVFESRQESWDFGQIAKPSTLFRNKSLMKKANSKSHKTLILIENLGDSARPFETKLEMAVKCYNLIGEMLTPDHKKLTLEILHRWTGYHNLTELQEFLARDIATWQANLTWGSDKAADNEKTAILDHLAESLPFASSKAS